MQARDYLRQAKILKIKIDQKRELLADLRTMAANGGGIDYSRERVQTSGVKSRLEEDAIRCADLEEEIREDIERYLKQRNEIIDMIHCLEDSRYIAVLHAKWIDGESFEQIAVDLNYNFGHVKRLHRQGVTKIQNILDKNVDIA